MSSDRGNVDLDTTAWDEAQQLDSIEGWQPTAGSESAATADDEVIVFRPPFGLGGETNVETGPALDALPPASLMAPLFGLGTSTCGTTGGIASNNPFALTPEQRRQHNMT